MGLQPGVDELFWRSLNRVLQCVKLRCCEKRKECIGFHKHGERLFFNKRRERERLERTRRRKVPRLSSGVDKSVQQEQ